MITITTKRIIKQGERAHLIMDISAPTWSELPKQYLCDREAAVWSNDHLYSRRELQYHTENGDTRILIYVGQTLSDWELESFIIPRLKKASDILREAMAEAEREEEAWCGVDITMRF